MSDEVNTGGPAFPMQDQQYAAAKVAGIEDSTERDLAYIAARSEAIGGMSLRDYFIAHAPAEPQIWFRPVMPPEPKARALRPSDLTTEEKKELDGWGEFLDLEDMKQPRAIAIATDWERHDRESKAWCAEQRKQHYVQWPAAWADEMLKAREAKE